MYGYVRPLRDELKVREYERYRGAYCGLCHTLKKRYGPALRFAVSYDLTFLALLLAGPGEGTECSPTRCPYHPLRRTNCPRAFPAMDAAADRTVILGWWKLRDGARDGGPAASLGYRLLCLLLRPAFRKAAARCPSFAAAAEEELTALAALEDEKSPGIDETADRFARLLQAAADGTEDEARSRVLRELLYHLGRIVYLLDAADDLRDDTRTGAYNPLKYRYTVADGKLSPDDEAALRLSLQHSHDRLCAAYALLEKNGFTEILDNIIYLGIPAMTQTVFSGGGAGQRKRGRNRL